jgi:hypothetical protein
MPWLPNVLYVEELCPTCDIESLVAKYIHTMSRGAQLISVSGGACIAYVNSRFLSCAQDFGVVDPLGNGDLFDATRGMSAHCFARWIV